MTFTCNINQSIIWYHILVTQVVLTVVSLCYCNRNAFVEHIDQFSYIQWQEWWNLCQDVKIWEVKPLLGEWSSSYRTSRREEIILSRLRIGHSYVTHSHLLRGEPPPLCEHCGKPLTIKHILIECTFFISLRTNYYNVSCLRDLFALTDPTKIFQYLKCINMFHKILILQARV